MALKAKRKLVLLKREVAYGVDPVPAAADAVKIYDAEFTREYDYTSDKRTLPWLARAKTNVAVKRSRLKGWVELAGAGAAGSIPAYSTILRACSFAEVNTPLTSTVYNPVSTGDESAACYFNIDGQRHKMLGTRGTITGIQFRANQLPRLQFELLGLPAVPDDSALPAPDFTAWKEGLVVNKANTPTFALHGFAGVLQTLEINMGTVLAFRDLVNANDVQATDREPSGTIAIEAPTVAAKNYFSIVDADTLGALQLVHGVGAGNIVQLDAPKVRLTDPAYQDSDGLAYLQMGLGLDPNAGNDEITLTIK